jgi:DNA-directed RNA polymerase subunit RPC12/RpoP
MIEYIDESPLNFEDWKEQYGVCAECGIDIIRVDRDSELDDGGRKRVGHKSCITCEKAFPYEGLFCPCCGQRIRHKSRHQGRTEYAGVRY